jgi:hypothetical protein
MQTAIGYHGLHRYDQWPEFRGAPCCSHLALYEQQASTSYQAANGPLPLQRTRTGRPIRRWPRSASSEC